MSFLDAVRGMMGGDAASGAGRLAMDALDLLQSDEHGGLQGLLEKFQQNGYGDAVKSWIGTGANLPISADDIQRVLGSERVREMAQRAGLPLDAASGHLAEVLPQLVDKLTAGGHLPDNALLQQAFSALRATLGR